eukprot:5737145-Pleurochrysis_carterae.AAC.2
MPVFNEVSVGVFGEYIGSKSRQAQHLRQPMNACNNHQEASSTGVSEGRRNITRKHNIWIMVSKYENPKGNGDNPRDFFHSR